MSFAITVTVRVQMHFSTLTSRSEPDYLAQRLAEFLLRQRLADRKVLVADDDRLSGLLMQALLKKVGLAVDIARDGVEVLERLAQTPDYLLVLMDLDMPRLDGLTATRVLRAAPRLIATPVIAVTARSFESDIAACHAAGMAAHVAKPVDAGLLYQTILACLNQDPARAR